MMHSIRVKKVSILKTWSVASRSRMLPFNIGLGIDEIVRVHRLRVRITPGVEDIAARLDWALIQKHDNNPDEQDLGLIFTRDGDNDIMARGHFTYVNGAISAFTNRNTKFSDEVDFPIPFVIPRSPTLELFTDSVTPSWNFNAELYYTKERVSHKILLALFKIWTGRKQNVVSSPPRVIVD